MSSKEAALQVVANLDFLEADQKKQFIESFPVLLTRARSDWPDLILDEQGFALHVVRILKVGRKEEQTQSQFLSELHASDLYLAYGCSVGNSKAIVAFEENYGRHIELFSKKFEGLYFSRDDLGQILREKLFVSHLSKKPKISEFQGKGSLLHWLRVTALRTFLDVQRSIEKRKTTEVRTDSAKLSYIQDSEILDGTKDFEFDFLKAHYRKEFKWAFEKAISRLTSQERNVLRYKVVDLLNIDQIAAIYGIHRSTAARRLTKAREKLMKFTRQNLRTKLSSNQKELESIINLVRSNLDLSLQRIFSTQPPDPP